MCGGLPKPTEILEAVGHGSEGDRKDRRNVEGPGRDVQGSDTIGDIIWQGELGGDKEYAQGTDGVPPLVSATHHGDDSKVQGRQRVGVPIGRGGDGRCGAPPHQGVHQEAAYNHSREGGLPPRL